MSCLVPPAVDSLWCTTTIRLPRCSRAETILHVWAVFKIFWIVAPDVFGAGPFSSQFSPPFVKGAGGISRECRPKIPPGPPLLRLVSVRKPLPGPRPDRAWWVAECRGSVPDRSDAWVRHSRRLVLRLRCPFARPVGGEAWPSCVSAPQRVPLLPWCRTPPLGSVLHAHKLLHQFLAARQCPPSSPPEQPQPRRLPVTSHLSWPCPAARACGLPAADRAGQPLTHWRRWWGAPGGALSYERICIFFSTIHHRHTSHP